MKEFWDQRYAEYDYAYGTKPNTFFKSQIAELPPGKILFPAEGEGRNAVYAASLGWEVYAFDFSTEAKKKADLLAERIGVEIEYTVADFENLPYETEFFDAVALIYAHFPANKRRDFHQKIQHYLKMDGTLLLEGFSTNQSARSSGGPTNDEMLFTIDELRKDFNLLKQARISEEEAMLNEGLYHQGIASVIRVVGKRKIAMQSVVSESEVVLK